MEDIFVSMMRSVHCRSFASWWHSNTVYSKHKVSHCIDALTNLCVVNLYKNVEKRISFLLLALEANFDFRLSTRSKFRFSTFDSKQICLIPQISNGRATQSRHGGCHRCSGQSSQGSQAQEAESSSGSEKEYRSPASESGGGEVAADQTRSINAHSPCHRTCHLIKATAAQIV